MYIQVCWFEEEEQQESIILFSSQKHFQFYDQKQVVTQVSSILFPFGLVEFYPNLGFRQQVLDDRIERHVALLSRPL
jgi:hypothetical protein